MTNLPALPALIFHNRPVSGPEAHIAGIGDPHLRLTQDVNLYDHGDNPITVRNPATGRTLNVVADGALSVYFQDHDARVSDRASAEAYYAKHGKTIGPDSDLETDFPDGAWNMNRWWDVYDDDTGDHMDMVAYDLNEVVADALATVLTLPELAGDGQWAIIEQDPADGDWSVTDRFDTQAEALAALNEGGYPPEARVSWADRPSIAA